MGTAGCNWSGSVWVSHGWDGGCAFSSGAYISCNGSTVTSISHYSGCGWTPGRAAAGLVNAAGGGGETMAHEVGHNRGRRHTCCAGEMRCDNQYAGAHLGVYGIDLANPAAPVYLDPNLYHDIMSYCGPKWMSDITYDALRDSFRPASAAWATVLNTVRTADAVAQQEQLFCSGYIQAGQVTMAKPCYRFSSTSSAGGAGQGRNTMELQDVAGTVLFTRRFDTVGDSQDPVEGMGYFRQTVPWQAGTARGQAAKIVRHVDAGEPFGEGGFPARIRAADLVAQRHVGIETGGLVR